MEMVSKPCQDRFLQPILVHTIIEKNENTGSQMGHIKKIFFFKYILSEIMKISYQQQQQQHKEEPIRAVQQIIMNN